MVNISSRNFSIIIISIFTGLKYHNPSLLVTTICLSEEDPFLWPRSGKNPEIENKFPPLKATFLITSANIKESKILSPLSCF